MCIHIITIIFVYTAMIYKELPSYDFGVRLQCSNMVKLSGWLPLTLTHGTVMLAGVMNNGH